MPDIIFDFSTCCADAAERNTAHGAAQLGAAIAATRAKAGQTQGQLAAHLKTALTNIVRVEKGRSTPSTNTLQRIAKATKHQLIATFRPVA